MQLFVVDEKDEAPEKPQIIEIDVNNHNYVKEFQVFADTILADAEMETSVYEGAKTVEVCLAIIESAKTEEKVKPNYNFSK
jgi:predicted dehydrogenase